MVKQLAILPECAKFFIIRMKRGANEDVKAS
jgi:hypothetical protein